MKIKERCSYYYPKEMQKNHNLLSKCVLFIKGISLDNMQLITEIRKWVTNTVICLTFCLRWSPSNADCGGDSQHLGFIRMWSELCLRTTTKRTLIEQVNHIYIHIHPERRWHPLELLIICLGHSPSQSCCQEHFAKISIVIGGLIRSRFHHPRQGNAVHHINVVS